MTANLPITNVNASNDHIVARTAEQVERGQDGVDITLNTTTGFYSITRVQRGLEHKPHLMHVSRVDLVTVM